MELIKDPELVKNIDREIAREMATNQYKYYKHAPKHPIKQKKEDWIDERTKHYMRHGTTAECMGRWV